MNEKKEKGKFYTTNYKYIFSGLSLSCFSLKNFNIVEPFVGQGSLIEFIQNDPEYKNVEKFDIDENLKTLNLHLLEGLEIRNTLDNPPPYDGKIVITNPPFLYRNKSKDKYLFDKYKTNDLYKCFLLSIIKNPPLGGIIILPLNFFSSIRKEDCKLRENFFSQFQIARLNIFQEQVFNDTSINVCSFLFKKKSIWR
jgi:hypothetical protein